MRSQLESRPLDLYFSLLYTIAIAGLLLVLGWDRSDTFLLFLITPGYLITATIFPDNTRVSWLRRALLSFGASVASLVVIVSLFKLTSSASQVGAVIVAMALLSAASFTVAFQRRMNLPIETRLSTTIRASLHLGDATTISKVFSACLAVSLVLTTVTLSYFLLVPTPSPQFTEFYLLGPGANTTVYPTQLTASEIGVVVLGITSHESDSVNYTVQAYLIGLRPTYNKTGTLNGAVEVNRTLWPRFNVTLAAGENWTGRYSFSIGFPGLWKIQFVLFKGADLSSEYREVHLVLRVT